LVGGHCIGVDPYYLAEKAQQVGYQPEIIIAGRRMNDSMGSYVASEVVKLMIKKDVKIKGATLLVLGITFKENCPDLRNTKVVDVINDLVQYGTNVTVFDPWANPDEVLNAFDIELMRNIPQNKFDVIVLTVAHNEFLKLDFLSLLNKNGVIYDVKGVLDFNVDGKL